MQKFAIVSKWVVGLLIGFSLSTAALAAPERTDLIKIANEGLSYFLASASFNKAFVNSLTPEQKIIVNELSQILEENSAIKFYEANKIEGFPMADGRRTFAYVDQRENVKSFATANAKAVQLIFSRQREDFKNLKPDEPERFLKTTSDFSGSIFVNFLKLNEDANMPFDLGRAVSILVHEYGHKVRQSLEKKKNKKFADAEIQPFIDKLGEDLGNYIRGKINKFPLKNGVVIYAVESLDFDVQTWLDQGFIRPEGRVSFLADQGLYMWSDFQGEIKDISNLVRAQTIKNALPTSTLHDPFYKFVNLNMLLPTHFKVIESNPGEVSISMTTGQASMQLPFMQPKVSPDPKQAKFNERYRWSLAGHAIIPATTTIQAQFNGPHVILKSSQINPRQITPLPPLSAQIGSVRIEKNDLVFNVDVKDKEGHMTFIGLSRGLMIRASEIKVRNQSGQVFYLTSESIDGSRAMTERTSGFVFRLNDAANIPDQSFEIESVYLRSEPDLISPNSEIRLEIPQFEKLQVNVPKIDTQADQTIAAVQIVSVTAENEIVRIRLKSEQPVQKVSLVLAVQDIMYSLITATGRGENLFYKFTENMTMDRLVEVTIKQNQFQTVKKDGLSEIQFKLADIFKESSFTVEETVTNQHGVTQSKGIALVLNPTAKLQEVSVLTTALQTAIDSTERTLTLFSPQSSKSKESIDFIIRDFSTKPIQHRVLFGGGLCSDLFKK